MICEPPEQTIDELGKALLASRSAITGAVSLLTRYHAVCRTRFAGQRVDYVTLDPRALDPTGFAGTTYQEQAKLAREALELLKDGDTVRRSMIDLMIDEGAAFYEFLAERMPALLTEWHAQRNYPGTGR